MQDIILSPIPLEQLVSVINETIRKSLEDYQKNQTSVDSNKRYTIADVCQLFSISKPTVHKHMHKGLPFEKIGRKTLFRSEEVDSYFKSLRRN
jgi:excisionase family DNA binding protein